MNRYEIPLIIILIMTGCIAKKEQTKSITMMESPTQSVSGEPYLFTDEKGTVYLSWLEKQKSNNEFKFSKLVNDKWSEPALIDSGKTWFVNWADYPMIATNGREFIAHYLDKNGESTYAYDVKMTSSQDSGKTWTPSTVLHDDGKQAEHGFVSLIPYGENFFVAWLDGRNTVMEGMENHEGHDGHHGQMSLRAAILDKEGKKLNEWELDNRTCDCCQTSAAITDKGPVVVYRDRSDEEIRDMSIVRLINGEWTKPKAIHDDQWKIQGCPVNGPRVVANGNKVAVAWFSIPTDKSEVKVAFSMDGGETFGKPIQVDEGKAIGRVDIVLLDNENAMVSWMEGTEIKAVKVNKNGDKGEAIIIANSSESRSSGFPQMTKSGDRLFFAWTDDKEKTIKTAFLSI